MYGGFEYVNLVYWGGFDVQPHKFGDLVIQLLWIWVRERSVGGDGDLRQDLGFSRVGIEQDGCSFGGNCGFRVLMVL